MDQCWGEDVYRGTFAVVDLRAIRWNLQNIMSRLSPGTDTLVAVKANGYGHGAPQVARAAAAAGASYLGVASVEEALKLRAAGIQTPILVLGATNYEGAVVAARHDVEVALTESCLAWPQVSADMIIRGHLKLDTGMSRLGLKTVDGCRAFAQWLKTRPDVKCVGVFTHLACADAADLTHAERQMEQFRSLRNALAEAGVRPLRAHAANSAAALRRPDWHEDMVRIGISAYGYAPSRAFALPVALRPALSLYSFVTRVEALAPGETVGYGATFQADRPCRIATVPVGYADGYPRILSNRSWVWLHGRRAPVVGNVCMDQLMVDVTDILDVAVGDCVTLYGYEAPSEWRSGAAWTEGGGTEEGVQTWLRNGYERAVRMTGVHLCSR
ncbi:alanine racemase [Alicyclobacillus contaminans]|nr:alanine racemase [Alicyclobacillus contaminans]